MTALGSIAAVGSLNVKLTQMMIEMIYCPNNGFCSELPLTDRVLNIQNYQEYWEVVVVKLSGLTLI